MKPDKRVRDSRNIIGHLVNALRECQYESMTLFHLSGPEDHGIAPTTPKEPIPGILNLEEEPMWFQKMKRS